MKKIFLLPLIILLLLSCSKDNEIKKADSEPCTVLTFNEKFFNASAPEETEGAETVLTFDSNGKPITGIETVTNALHKITRTTIINYLYDINGRIIKIIRDPDDNPKNEITYINYNGDFISEVITDLNTTKYFFNSTNQLIKEEIIEVVEEQIRGGTVTLEYKSTTTQNPFNFIITSYNGIKGSAEVQFDDKKILRLPGRNFSPLQNNVTKMIRKDEAGNIIQTIDYNFEYNSQGYVTKMNYKLNDTMETAVTYSCK